MMTGKTLGLENVCGEASGEEITTPRLAGLLEFISL